VVPKGVTPEAFAALRAACAPPADLPAPRDRIRRLHRIGGALHRDGVRDELTYPEPALTVGEDPLLAKLRKGER